MTTPHENPLLQLIALGQRARAAATADELAFMLVNETRELVAYRQAALWSQVGGLRSLSGIVQVDRQTPFALFLEAVCRHLSETTPDKKPRHVQAQDLPNPWQQEWAQWWPAHALWIPLAIGHAQDAKCDEGLLLVSEEALAIEALPLLREWCNVWEHAWRALYRPLAWSVDELKVRYLSWWRGEALTSQQPWWRRRSVQVATGVVFVLCFPVQMTVLATGELVPVQPALVRSPMDGVIERFWVQPNQSVKSGDVLLTFDQAPIGTRLEMARQAFSTAQAEYRQLTQLALGDVRAKGQIAAALGKMGEKQAEVEYLESQFERSKVTAPQDGVVMMDDPSEWMGKPVQTGERILRVADPTAVEVEAWIPVGDAIPLETGAAVNLYLAATPFSSIQAELRYVAHDAVPRPDGVYAYRARAKLTQPSQHRVGLKGTAKLSGGWMPLAYWVTRRPLAVIRQFLAV